MVSLKRKAIIGSLWTFAGFGSSQFIRLIGNIILTRLLVPEFFGVMAVVNSLKLGFLLLSDFGVKQSLIQSKKGDDPVALNTAWTIEVIRGFFLLIICCLCAIPAVQVYGNSSFYWLMPVVGATAFIQSCQSTAIIGLRRKLNVGKEMAFEIFIQVFSLTITIIWASFSPTLLSLAVGLVAGASFRTLGSYWFFADKRNKFMLDRKAVAEIFGFGKWLFIATTLVFLAEQGDRLILGKLLPLDVLGVYSVALSLSILPRQIVKKLGNQVIFPVISRRSEFSREKLRTEVLRQRQKLLILFGLMLLPLVICGDAIISLMYDSRYAAATWMLPILALGVWFSVLFNTANFCLMGVGKPIYGALGNGLRFLTISIGLFVGYRYGGILGTIIVMAISDVPAYIGVQFGLFREKLSFLSQDFTSTVLFVSVVATLLMVRAWLGLGSPFSLILG
ncbi:oligosaccharide flippase family protein [Leptothoe spongobia]|uniref:Oligosaccharide flippase family protein n=1 Tax=Leptothoe spongobia TAU-MAC 1115 TaxID=1967444 RepID=A0A947DI59_9CYAN|nr:oligosaccharide flippase family protein [Leptothoe spongobia]MBT9317465.1 oligosaccharide flippase family protein [Leptothoe spongobia TAU-MAC 1115]